MIEQFDSQRSLHVYDSFEGLPPAGPRDAGTPFERGMLSASQDALLMNFKSFGLRPPVIHAGWFKDTLPSGLPNTISFAHLDGDFYDSILESGLDPLSRTVCELPTMPLFV